MLYEILYLLQIFENFKEGIHSFIYIFNIANPRITNVDVAIFKKIKVTVSYRENLKYTQIHLIGN